MIRIYSQSYEVLPLSFGLLPVLPYAITQPVAKPFIYLLELTVYGSQLEVVCPSADHPIEPFNTLIKGLRYGLAGYCLQFLLQRFPSLFTYYQLIFAPFPFLVTRHEGVSEQLERQRAAYATFLPVDG